MRRDLNVLFAILLGFTFVGCAQKAKREVRSDAVVVHGQVFPNTKVVNGKTLTLVNASEAKTIYLGETLTLLAIGMYMEKPTNDPKQALVNDQMKHVDFRVLDYDLPDDEYTEGFRRTISKACYNECDKNKENFAELAKAIGGSKRRVGTWTITVTPTATTVESKTNKPTTKTFSGKSIGEAVFAIYWGPHPVKEDAILGQGLLAPR